MKKLVVVLIVAISLLSLTSCEDYAEKADYEEQINATTHRDADNGGGDNDDEETGSE